MKLSKKTFWYSISIAGVLVIFVIMYFAFMLPSLYVEHMEQANLDSIVEVQRGYVKERSYRNLKVKNPTGSATLEIPLSGDTIYVAGKAFRGSVTLNDADAKKLLDKFRTAFLNADETGKVDLSFADWEVLKDKLITDNQLFGERLVSIQLEASNETDGVVYKDVRIHRISKDTFVFEGGMKDGENQYTTYIACSQTKDALIFSILPVTTPKMTEIRPIVMGSLPMIVAVVLFLMLICSQVFSRGIVNPVIRLANYAEEVKNAGTKEISPLEIRGSDEISELGKALNELYARLREQYRQLEDKNRQLRDKNRILAGENKRQEIFMRASSHQLKTPVAAALLLVEGMIGEVGKYKDTKAYLPEIKKQLKSMQKIVEDILYLNHCAEHIQKEKVDIKSLAEEAAAQYQIPIEEKQLKLCVTGRKLQIFTDRELTKKILDNLLSNAVSYTPDGQEIRVEIRENGVNVLNRGGRIDEKLLPHIYEPFVSSNIKQKGRGLGLYIASYYAEILGYSLEVSNASDGVRSSLVCKNLHDIFI